MKTGVQIRLKSRLRHCRLLDTTRSSRAVQVVLMLAAAAFFVCELIGPAPAVMAYGTRSVVDPPTASTSEQPADPIPDPVEQVDRVRHLPNGVQIVSERIDGLSHAAILILFHNGSNSDPVGEAGMTRLIDRIFATAATDQSAARTFQGLDEKYPEGWNTQTFATHSIFGAVVPDDLIEATVEDFAHRLTNLNITAEDITREVAGIHTELAQRFERNRNIVPMSYLLTKAFRHVDDPPRGMSPDNLARLSPEQVKAQWDRRTRGGNISLVLVGAVDGVEINAFIDKAFGVLSSQPVDPWPVNVRPASGIQKNTKIMNVTHLLGDKDQGVAAFYAPPVTSPDSPAFFVIARSLMRDAMGLPGAQARLEFQYDLILDPRAAYEVPMEWRYPKGPAQQLGYWDAKIKHAKFTGSDAKRAMMATGWQLGAPLSGELFQAMRTSPKIIYTIGVATAFRALYDGDDFWAGYRRAIEHLDSKTMASVRDKYFADSNRALYVLQAVPTPPEPGEEEGGK